jgi:hypothetical protein
MILRILVSANSNIRESLQYIRKRILLLKIRANYFQKGEFEFAFAHREFESNWGELLVFEFAEFEYSRGSGLDTISGDSTMNNSDLSTWRT